MRGFAAALLCWSIVLPISQAQQPPPTYPKLTKLELFARDIIPEDLQVSIRVQSYNTSRFFYLHTKGYGPLTIIMSPCNGSVNSTVHLVRQFNATLGYLKDIGGGSETTLVDSTLGSSRHVYSWASAPGGLYRLDLVAAVDDTIVTLYLTNLAGVPPALRIHQTPKLRLHHRLHRNRVTLRWDQSVVDPLFTYYYVVVNSKYNFTSLCEAEAKLGIVSSPPSSVEKPPNLENKIQKKAIEDRNNFKAVNVKLGEKDMLITCVESDLSFTISGLQKGRNYYFNIFAMNIITQLSFPYANAAMTYDPKLRPMGLKDNKLEAVNIRKMGGRALFRYKVRAGTMASLLNWHVMPCGGVVLAEVRLRKQVILPRVTIEGYRHLQVPNVLPGQRYTLLLLVPDAKHMRQISGVEVLATTRTSLMPHLPAESRIHEFSSMRTCNSITVTWLPVTSQSVRYCVSASPVPVTESMAHFRSRPNQCNLDSRLRTQYDFAVKQCQDISANDHSNDAMVETISNLQPGKEYLIQVTVKKLKGKALSYDLLRVRTEESCEHNT